MNNETLRTILEIPLFWRAAIALFVIWFVYMLASRGIFKLLSLAVELIDFVWFLVYKVFNNICHPLHKMIGNTMCGVDQTVTDFFGGVYGFVTKVKDGIENCYRTKTPVLNKDGSEQKERDGSVKYNYTPKKPFVGTAFLIATVLVLWIAAPTWLHITDSQTAFTSAYHKYVEVEGKVLSMVFGS